MNIWFFGFLRVISSEYLVGFLSSFLCVFFRVIISEYLVGFLKLFFKF